MVSIRMTARGFQNNRSLLNELKDNQDEEIQKLLVNIGNFIVDDAKHTLQQNQNIDSGRLLASVKILDEKKHEITVGSDAFHAQFIEFGRGPIFAAPGKVLHFITKDGVEVFTHSSKAVEPMPFLGPAVEKHTRGFSDLYVEQNEAIIRAQAAQLLDTEFL